MEASVELGLSVVFGIVAFAGVFATIVHHGKKMTEKEKRNKLQKC